MEENKTITITKDDLLTPFQKWYRTGENKQKHNIECKKYYDNNKKYFKTYYQENKDKFKKTKN